MEQDLATLQVISETLKEDPHASQRTLAKKVNMSLGMMNAILGRFAERGWVMLTNVNGRKIAYAVTPDGISELAERGKKFAIKTLKIANEYNDVIYKLILTAKTQGKTKVTLYGKSYIKFLLAYLCKTLEIDFFEKEIDDNLDVEFDSYNLIGELEDNNTQVSAVTKTCVNLLEIIGSI